MKGIIDRKLVHGPFCFGIIKARRVMAAAGYSFPSYWKLR